uniref:Uncharacterized protein n=1 Tax=Rhizophora mucronata TaxID=61149 RepID=A0A2P2PYL5_RHIMU
MSSDHFIESLIYCLYCSMINLKVLLLICGL